MMTTDKVAGIRDNYIAVLASSYFDSFHKNSTEFLRIWSLLLPYFLYIKLVLVVEIINEFEPSVADFLFKVCLIWSQVSESVYLKNNV